MKILFKQETFTLVVKDGVEIHFDAYLDMSEDNIDEFHLFYCGSFIGSVSSENKQEFETAIEKAKNVMNINDITSIGWLHNADNSIALTVCLRYQMQPVFVSISKVEYEAVGGIDAIQNDKKVAIDFFEKYGAGRSYKGHNL